MQFLLPVQRFLIMRKAKIVWVMFLFELSLLIIFPRAAYLYQYDIVEYLKLYELGKTFGQVAVILFSIVLVPGILRRFQILPIVQAIIMPFRRHIGIIMFMLALCHSWILYVMPLLFPFTFSGFFHNIFLSWHITFGVLSELVLFPLWVTSNDYSQYKFKQTWKKIHQLVYIATFTIFIHVALASTPSPMNNFLKILMGVMTTLLIASWVKSIFFKKQLPVAPVPVPTLPTTPLPPPTPPRSL